MERILTIKVVDNPGVQLDEQTIQEEILLAETRMNINSKLRFHITDVLIVGSKGELDSNDDLEEVFNIPQESTKLTPLDRYGICPNEQCRMDWNGGDILEGLARLDVLGEKSKEELVNIAHLSFGYQVQNPKNFSKVIAVQVVKDTKRVEGEIPKPDFYMCPNCRQVWEADTGRLFSSLNSAKNNEDHEQFNREFFNNIEVEAAKRLDD